MSTLQVLFQQAQLAEAAYANFYAFPNNPKGALEDEGFSATQAAEFVKQWRVANHIPDTPNGFSATLFERLDTSGNGTGQFSLAIRGSTFDTFGLDFQADVADIFIDGIVLDQLVDMYNYWQRLTAAQNASYQIATLDTLTAETAALRAAYLLSPVAGLAYEALLRSRTDVVIDNPSHTVRTIQFATSAQADGFGLSATAVVDVSGHSLGGHLATAFSRLFSGATGNVVGVNGLGFVLTNSNVNNLFALLGGAAGFDAGKILNVYGEKGFEVAAQNAFLKQVGGYQGIEIESATLPVSAALGHSAVQMTDSLALYNLFATFDPALNTSGAAGIQTITGLLKAASNIADRTLESALDALRVTLLGKSAVDADPTAEGDRDQLYKNLYDLQATAEYKVLAGSASLRVLAYSDRDALVSKAKSDFGFFLAVKHLLPVAIEGSWGVLGTIHTDLYTQWQADKALTPEQRKQGMATYSDEYLADRAAFLTWKNKLALEDADASTTAYNKGGATDQWFRDNASNLTINLGSGAAPADKRRFIFDGDTGNTLSGGSQSDRLYGGGGNDVLYGFDRNDYLEGNAGDDELHGGGEDDTLVGGAGDDKLYGGTGFDTYIVGQGVDTIIDEDGKGVVKDEQGRLIAGAFIRGADGRYVWAGDAQVTATHNSPLTLTLENGAEIVVENYDEMGRDGLGLRLVERPGMETAGFRLGDRPTYRYPERSGEPPLRNGSRYSYGTRDAEGREEIGITHADIPEEWLNARVVESERRVVEETSTYVVYETTRLVMAYSLFEDTLAPIYGDDIVPREDVFRMVGGPSADWRIESGQMSDFVVGGIGNDVIAGGAAPDVLMSSNGDDTVFGGDVVDVTAFLEESGTAAGTGLRGDWISGGRGNDTLVGAGGDDEIYGGEGNDTIAGDGEGIAAGYQGNDTLDGEAGDDYLRGYGGDDLAFGGAGNDGLGGGQADRLPIEDKELGGVRNDSTGDSQALRYGGRSRPQRGKISVAANDNIWRKTA